MNAKAARARHDAHALRRSDRPVAATTCRRRTTSPCVVGAAAEYPLIREFSTTRQPLRRGAARPGRCSASTTRTTSSRTRQWDIQLSQDRLHPRGRQVPRDAGDDRQPAVRDRAARFGRQVHARRATRSASGTGSRPARRWPPPSREQAGGEGRQGARAASSGTLTPTQASPRTRTRLKPAKSAAS